MAKLERGRGVALLALGIFALILVQACARSEPLGTNGLVTPPQSLPFHPENGQVSSDDRVNSAVAQPSNVPFKAFARTRVLPTGTLLTVDLQGALSTAKVHAGDTFTATVAAPLILDGEALIPRGAPATGRVESAQPGRSGMAPGSGYFELILCTITVDGRTIVLQTSSLFARGTGLHSHAVLTASSTQPISGGVRVQKGRALIFRLTAPVTVDWPAPTSMPNQNSSGHTGE